MVITIATRQKCCIQWETGAARSDRWEKKKDFFMGLLVRKGHWSNEEEQKYMMAKNIIKSLGICGLCITVERRADVLAKVALGISKLERVKFGRLMVQGCGKYTLN